MNLGHFHMTKLAKRLVVWLLAISSGFALVLTAIQIYSEFHTDVENIDQGIVNVENAYMETLAQSVWNLDVESVEATLRGISSVPGVVYIEVMTDRFGSIAKVGIKNPEATSYDLPIVTKNTKENIKVGTLNVLVTYRKAFGKMWERLGIILVYNFFKSICVSLIIFVVIYNLYTKHIKAISEYLSSLSSETLKEPLVLDRKSSSSDPDELDVLQNSIEKMRLDLGEALDQVSEKLSENEEMKQQMLEVAHEVGVAETASEIFHNVNNVLSPMQFCVFKIRRITKKMREDGDESHANELDPISNKMERCIDLAASIIRIQQSHAALDHTAQTIELKRFVNDVVSMMGQIIRVKDVEVTNSVDEDIHVNAVQSQLFHVAINLVKNACEAMTSVAYENRTLRFLSEKHDGYVLLRVVDSGVGISPEQMKKMFTRGYTSKSDGHGFGLSSCLATMKSMGGDLSVDSEGVGKGSTFTLKIPLRITSSDVA